MKPIPLPSAGQMTLLLTPYVAGEVLVDLTARLALRGPLRVLDGGNTFNAYYLARALRRQTPDFHAVMSRVELSRAFTCYQMSALLDSSLAHAARPLPTLALDFLAMFCDENVALGERRRLLQRCVKTLRVLSRQAPVAVWVRLRPARAAEMGPLLAILRPAATQVWRLETLEPASLQPELF